MAGGAAGGTWRNDSMVVGLGWAITRYIEQPATARERSFRWQ